MTHKKVDIPLEGIEIRLNGIDPYREYRFKFIVIATREGEYLRGPIYKDIDLGEHADIVRNAQEQEGLEGHVMGGGWIQLRPQKKRLYAFGHSERYGSAPQLLVERLLEEYCSDLDYKLNVVMDDIVDRDTARKLADLEKGIVQGWVHGLEEFKDKPQIRECYKEECKQYIEKVERGEIE